MARVWCCLACGRFGTRGFTYAPNDDKARVCANDRACRRRTTRAQQPHPDRTPR